MAVRSTRTIASVGALIFGSAMSPKRKSSLPWNTIPFTISLLVVYRDACVHERAGPEAEPALENQGTEETP